MTGEPDPAPHLPVAIRACEHAPRDRPQPSGLLLLLVLSFTTILGVALASARADGSADAPSRRTGMAEAHTGALLVTCYETFLHDRDLDAFRRQVLAWYMESTLARLSGVENAQTRRAAVFALGLVGSYQHNPTVARALRDPDRTVRILAENALWAIWFLADTAENNAALERVSLLIGHREYRKATFAATCLIERAPTFSEAYNQRAIAEYYLGEFQASADDCRLVLEHNPYHIGALTGLAKCLLQLDRRDDAIEALRRSSRLQPYNEELKHLISALEAANR